jgi:hypothetical protein
MTKYNGINYDDRHGGAFDRGAADSYYRRGINPHYYAGPTAHTPEILLTPSDPLYLDYMAGWNYNEDNGNFKY